MANLRYIASQEADTIREIGLKGIIEDGIKWILEKVDWDNTKESNTGDWSGLVLFERDDSMHILDAKTVKVNGDEIKANVFYMLKDGVIVEVSE